MRRVLSRKSPRQSKFFLSLSKLPLSSKKRFTASGTHPAPGGNSQPFIDSDIVLYVKKKKRLFLIEAVTSHGPVNPKRQFELEEMLKDCYVVRIYLSAFPGFKEFKNHLREIEW